MRAGVRIFLSLSFVEAFASFCHLVLHFSVFLV